jgi:cellulose synthase/poly-beta-1,6-N-acetylglucosamine synthase-like glycosyltransferase
MNGECFAVRRELALKYQDEYTNQVFLGKKCESGDDGWITTLLLKYGHKTVFQSTAVAVTEPPPSFWGFLKQQLRWNRNSTRRSLTALKQKWAYQRGALYPLHMFVSLIKSPFWIGVIVIAAARLAMGNPVEVISTAWLEPVWQTGRFFIFLGGVIVIRGLRGIPYLITDPKALIFLPLYAFIAPFIMVPCKLYAMVTSRNVSWLTRGHDSTKNGRGKGIKMVSRSILMAVMFALAFSFPLASLAFACEDECECY